MASDALIEAKRMQARAMQQAMRAQPLSQQLAGQGAAQIEAGRDFLTAPSLPQFAPAAPEFRRETDSSGFMGDALRAVLGGGGGRTAADVGAGAPEGVRERILESGGTSTGAMAETAALGAALTGGATALSRARPSPSAPGLQAPAGRGDHVARAANLEKRARAAEAEFLKQKGLKPLDKGFRSPAASEIWKDAQGIRELNRISQIARKSPHAARKALENIANNPKQMGRFSPEHQDAIRKLAHSENVGTALRELGFFRSGARAAARVVGRKLDSRATRKPLDKIMRDLEG